MSSHTLGPKSSKGVMKLRIASYGMIDHDRPIGAFHGRVWEMRPPYLAGVEWIGCIPDRNSHQLPPDGQVWTSGIRFRSLTRLSDAPMSSMVHDRVRAPTSTPGRHEVTDGCSYLVCIRATGHRPDMVASSPKLGRDRSRPVDHDHEALHSLVQHDRSRSTNRDL